MLISTWNYPLPLKDAIAPARLRAFKGTTPPRQPGTQQETEDGEKEFQEIAEKLERKFKPLITLGYFA
jgi:hypothetical protein